MSMYRIKKADGQPTDTGENPSQTKEYWQTDPLDFAEDLDPVEIAELNELIGEDDAQDEQKKGLGKPWVKAMIVASVIVALLLWGSIYLVSHSLDWNILTKSAELAEDESLASLRESVVVIEGTGGNGTGFNVAADGLIVTNRHVVEDSGIITIRFGGENGEAFTTREWIEIPDVDMAIIDIEAEGLPYLRLNQSYPYSGEEIIFIGNPLGYDWTISQGTVIEMVDIEGIPMIYFEGPVHPGSSGSPIFNSNSEVIGVIFASLVDQENQGLAIPIAYFINYWEASYEH